MARMSSADLARITTGIRDRFGVSAASAIRWRQLVVQHGTPAAKPQGGDRRAARIDAHAAFILAAIEAKDDITLAELQV